MVDRAFIERLLDAKLYTHPVTHFKILETHISWVILTGPYAYKIKKPVDFKFLNYTSLEKRKHYCYQEIEYNKPLAASLYMDVIPIGEVNAQLKIGSDENIVEYAIKMHEFSQQGLLNELIKNNKLSTEIIDDLANQIAHFHLTSKKADNTSVYGTPEMVHQPVTQNFEQIRPYLTDKNDFEALQYIEHWANETHKSLYPIFQSRKEQQKICACHGDLHLGNMVLIDQKPVIFDCIEFNEALRWIDPMAEVGFLYMDLLDHARPDLAALFLNSYMEITGDYEGLALLPYYISYRAMVRAKIKLFSLNDINQLTEEKISDIFKCYRHYVYIAQSQTQHSRAALFITYGLSGSGKSTVSRYLVQKLQVIQIRSDVERKKLLAQHQLKADDLYSEQSIDNVYQHLAQLADFLLQHHQKVIVDATFLLAKHRARFEALTKKYQCDFHILHCQASHEQLQTAILNRQNMAGNVSDATLAVLEDQKEMQEPLSEAELAYTTLINGENVSFVLTKLVKSPTL